MTSRHTIPIITRNMFNGSSFMSKQAISISSLLTRQEAEECKVAFDRRDVNQMKFINLKDLREVLQEVNQLPPDDELFELVLKLNLDSSGTITFQQFIRLVEMHKEKQHGNLDDNGTLEAFVVCGGNPDKTGTVETRKITKIVKQYELPVDIESILAELDRQQTGAIDYYKFSSIFVNSSKHNQKKRQSMGMPRQRSGSIGKFPQPQRGFAGTK
ncbi:putative Dynein 18 kDa light chain, flagellar outer arm [Blattamonas nauphoetae]|uniref:Dynein 18 kDa light chain, flagellar outer arm n=1 Tax=Blattamonas nauphoetae TaxID=2049346 RepID=A0ABQ9XNU4_9EUKA|nr:putative Dynein 18 kDa light chain, flagellar outer arm [Blattamonas nauphoetae]